MNNAILRASLAKGKGNPAAYGTYQIFDRTLLRTLLRGVKFFVELVELVFVFLTGSLAFLTLRLFRVSSTPIIFIFSLRYHCKFIFFSNQGVK